MDKELIRILHVEDDEIDRQLVKRILVGCSRPIEFNIESVNRMSAAIERLDNRDYDIALLDLGLPDTSGIESVQMVKRADPNIPIVVLTGTGDEEIGLLAIKNGAMEYLSKGMALEELLVRTILYALERKKAEMKIKETVEIKSEFISMVSHELRTPLTAIKEGIAIVLDEAAGEINDDQKELLDIAKRNVDRLARLINDVLDFQKLSAGKMRFDMQEKDINEIVKEVHKTMVCLAKEKGLDFSFKAEESLPKVSFDSDKITQVLTNLVNNAIKFTEKGSINISTNDGENKILVSVSDTGCGIEQEDLPKVFRQFEQLAKGGARKTGGTGLGLAISKEIIEQHRGKIWTESEIDKGTTFHFVLPVKERRKAWRRKS